MPFRLASPRQGHVDRIAEGDALEPRALGRDLASALAYIHAQGILHRDLRPANVFLCNDGRTVLVDFGLAKSTDVDATQLTAQGQVVGTPAYMAPEVLVGGPATEAADVYALGLILYEVAARRHLFVAAGSGILLADRLVGKIPPAQFAAFEAATAYTGRARYTTTAELELRDHPVVGVPYTGALAYCAWVGKTLPDEDRWELAARGPEPRTYPWGEELGAVARANFRDRAYGIAGARKKGAEPTVDLLERLDDGFLDTAPVGHYPSGASPYGALDMVRNVADGLGAILTPPSLVAPARTASGPGRTPRDRCASSRGASSARSSSTRTSSRERSTTASARWISAPSTPRPRRSSARV